MALSNRYNIERVLLSNPKLVPPFSINLYQHVWRVVDASGLPVGWVSIQGNSKQRRQQRRALERQLNH